MAPIDCCLSLMQRPFSPALKSQIRADARIMVEVSDCLANLDIAIGFLVSVGGDPEKSLHSFMTDTLQMGARGLTPRVSILKCIYVTIHHQKRHKSHRIVLSKWLNKEKMDKLLHLLLNERYKVKIILHVIASCPSVIIYDIYESIGNFLTIYRHAIPKPIVPFFVFGLSYFKAIYHKL